MNDAEGVDPYVSEAKFPGRVYGILEIWRKFGDLDAGFESCLCVVGSHQELPLAPAMAEGNIRARALGENLRLNQTDDTLAIPLDINEPCWEPVRIRLAAVFVMGLAIVEPPLYRRK